MISGVASVWAVASPMAQGCAAAAEVGPTGPSPSEAQDFVTKLNELRASKGLNALVVDANLTSIAQSWSAQMAANGAISHRSDLSSGVTSNWRRLGENVGVGPSVDQLMAAFTASQAHYDNMVDPTFTHIGVGTFRTADGVVYTAHEFAFIKAAAPAPVPAPTPAAVSAPRPTTPRVTTAVTAAPVPPTTTPTTAASTTTTEPPTSVVHTVAAPTHHASHTCNA